MKNILSISPEFIQNPYPYYSEMLKSDEPFWLPTSDKNGFNGIWIFSKYTHADYILKLDSAKISKQIEKVVTSPTPTILDQTMLNMDPPDHRRLRKLGAEAFSPSILKNIEPKIISIADNIINKIKINSEIDFIKSVALPLPVGVIAYMMGVPDNEQELVRDWAVDILSGIDSSNNSKEGVLATQKNAYDSLLQYFTNLISLKDKKPDDSITSNLVLAFKNRIISFEELVKMCIFLLIVGYETTVGLIGNGLYCLLRHPNQLHLLRNDSNLIDNTIEEMLRFESPFQRTSFRVTVSECQIGNNLYRSGEQIAIAIGAANRDPLIFKNPDLFDITRSKNNHIAFGLGIHACLGAYLARLEAKILLNLLLKSFKHIELLETPIWNNNSVIRNLSSLKISCE